MLNQTSQMVEHFFDREGGEGVGEAGRVIYALPFPSSSIDLLQKSLGRVLRPIPQNSIFLWGRRHEQPENLMKGLLQQV